MTTTTTTTTTAQRAPRMTFPELRVLPLLADGFRWHMSDNRAGTRRAGAYRAARAEWITFRQANGYAGDAPLLTPPSAQPKMGKSATPSYGLMLTPARSIALWADDIACTTDLARVNACPAATLGCESACLNTAGKGRMYGTQRARAVRTAFMLDHPHSFGVILAEEVARAAARHDRVLLRLNVVSDYRWELVDMFDSLPANVAAYDYTAWQPRHRGAMPANYSLTYSVKETWTVERMRDYVARGLNIAAVVNVKRGAPLPSTWHGMPVVDGDMSDDRTSDPRGVVVLLRAKGSAIGDTSGFVWDIAGGAA